MFSNLSICRQRACSRSECARKRAACRGQKRQPIRFEDTPSPDEVSRPDRANINRYECANIDPDRSCLRRFLPIPPIKFNHGLHGWHGYQTCPYPCQPFTFPNMLFCGEHFRIEPLTRHSNLGTFTGGRRRRGESSFRSGFFSAPSAASCKNCLGLI